MVLQELKRPTPSSILPLIPVQSAKEQEIVTYKYEYLCNHLKENYDAADVFTINDIEIEGWDKEDIQYTFSNIARRNKSFGLYPLGKRFYSLSPITYSDEEIAINYYSKKNNRLIGYQTKESFLYNIGYLKEKPDVVKMVTLRKTNKNASVGTIHGAKIKIYPALNTNINDRTIRILPIIDLFRTHKEIGIEAEQYLYDYIRNNNITFDEFENCLEGHIDRTKKRVHDFLRKGGIS